MCRGQSCFWHALLQYTFCLHLVHRIRPAPAASDTPISCPHPGCDKAFKVQKHLEYHTQLHNQPDAFSCVACGKNFSNPSSLRIHRLLDHESPELESAVERQLRETLNAVNDELEGARSHLSESQGLLNTLMADARDLRKLVRSHEPKLHALRREHVELRADVGTRVAAQRDVRPQVRPPLH